MNENLKKNFSMDLILRDIYLKREQNEWIVERMVFY